MARPVAVTRHRVGMADVDLVQVFFARMFTWMDIGFTELLDLLGHPSSTLLRSGWSTPVVDAHCSYRRPVTLDDRFELHSRVIEARGSSFLVGHDFVDRHGLFARGECRHVWIVTEPEHRAHPLPDWLRAADHANIDLPTPAATGTSPDGPLASDNPAISVIAGIGPAHEGREQLLGWRISDRR